LGRKALGHEALALGHAKALGHTKASLAKIDGFGRHHANRRAGSGKTEVNGTKTTLAAAKQRG
jgi:hypothetical protein